MVLLPHQPSSVGIARRRLAADLRAHGAREQAVGEAALVLSELVSNAIRHARPLPGYRVRIAWSVAGDVLELEVSDGGAVTSPQVGAPSTALPDGRGLAIVERLSLRWGVRAEAAKTTVWAELPVSASSARRPRARRAVVPSR